MRTVSVSATKRVAASTEEWRDSSIHPEIMVSSKGHVKAKAYRLVTKDATGDGFRIYDVPAKILDTTVGKGGDILVNITQSNGVQVTESVALLVAKEFATNEDPVRFTKVKFRDHDKANIKASNLYWDGVGPFARL